MKVKFTFWQETDGKYLGYLNEFPDYWTQGETLEDLKAHLRDLQDLFSDGTLEGVRHESELELV
jgi:predicted RNase H-like HicB family nuclease